MPTLDYQRATTKNKPEIELPPFHSGALGFIPQSEVTMAVSHPEDTGDIGELYVSPLNLSSNVDPFRLSATFKDEVGIVGRLLDAIWALNINVLTGETCTIRGGRLHTCEFLLDWRTSPFHALGESRPSDRRRYADLSEHLPIQEARYLALFKSVASFCADALHFRSGSDISTLAVERHAR